VILNFIVKGKRLLKVRGSHVHYKSGNISETVLDKDVVTTAQWSLTGSDTRIWPI